MLCNFGSAGSNPAAGREPGVKAAPDFSPAGILKACWIQGLLVEITQGLKPRAIPVRVSTTEVVP